jgi:large subunit ribosomal protein L13
LAVETIKVKADAPIVVDATNLIVGRMASTVAKLLLNGRRVIIVNSEKALISGSRINIVTKQLKRLEIGSVVNPEYNPHRYKEPNRMLHRIIRGMIPRKKPSGVAAMKRLRVYIGTPESYKSVEKKIFEDAKARKPLPMYVALGEVASTLGWTAR